MPRASSRLPRSSSRLADFWPVSHRRCSYAISQPCTTSRASDPRPSSFLCRQICSPISSHDRMGRSDLDQGRLCSRLYHGRHRVAPTNREFFEAGVGNMAERWHPDEPLPVIARFEVRRRAYLAPDGSINRQLPAFASDTRLLVRLYRAMVLVRAFDVKAVALQRTGRLGTYAASLGQEAVSVGTASAMHGEDVLLPSYRDNAALIWRGVELEEILLFWGGDERGNCFSGPVQDFPFCIPVGSQAPHAAGVAYAFKLRKEPRVAVCLFGDGATSKGDLWEAMNFAGVHKLPVVFVATNNQWAISVPLRLQTASETLAQKAIAAGFIGEQVDGHDVVAIYLLAEEAIEAARNGRGPRFIEAVTYRLGDHTTADDAARYRPTEEVQARWKEEPIARLRSFLAGQHAWSKTDEEQLSAECQQQIDAAVERYLDVKPRPPETMFDHLYAELPRAYAAQRRELEGND